MTFNNNFVGGSVERTTFESLDKVVDKAGLICVCSYEMSQCSDVTVTNNIAAGGIYAGLIIPGHKCGDYDNNKIYGNVAHSTGGPDMGHGIIFYNDGKPGLSDCIESSNNAAYKNYFQGIYYYQSTKHVKVSHNTMIDNRNGFGATLSGSGDGEFIVEISDNFVYGESASSDCPKDGSYCKPVEKYGYFMSGAQMGGKSTHITAMSPLPMPNVHSDGLWGTKIWLKRNRFEGFSKMTREGMRQSVMQLSPWQYDYAPMQEFFDNTFVDV